MGDGDDRPPFHQRIKLLLDRRLNLRIQCRCRLVEHQDRGVLQDHPRKRHALALPAGEFDAALADMGVIAPATVPIFQAKDEFVRLRLFRRGDDLRLRRLRLAVADVLRKIERCSSEVSWVTMAMWRRRLSWVTPAMSWPSIRMRPAAAIVEMQQQVDQGRFAGAGRADQPDAFAQARWSG